MSQLAMFALLPGQAAGFQGHWLGTVGTPQGKLRVALHVEGCAVTLDNLDQSVMGIPANRLSVE